MRGEHQTETGRQLWQSGSSPHARGTPYNCIRNAYKPGIIPACAGNTGMDCKPHCHARDHPRMRGEHFVLVLLMPMISGSSPHARGTLRIGQVNQLRAGIIPACAGNTAPHWRPDSTPWDHPRMRGEHLMKYPHARISVGSSPHARGTPDVTMVVGARGGIIPACAGNTGKSRQALPQAWDHPRMRGEHYHPINLRYRHSGSSPHARGTP